MGPGELMQEQRITTIVWRGKWLILVSLVLSIALAVFVTQHSKRSTTCGSSSVARANGESSTG